MLVVSIMRAIFTAIFLGAIASTCASASEKIDKAKEIFSEYQEMGKSYDAGIVKLYSDEAKIENTRIFPDGKKQVTKFEVEDYKKIIEEAMPIAKTRGDYSTYSDVEYAEGEENVTITATRFSTLKKYESPLKIVVGPDEDETWRILEEISVTKP